MKRWQWFWGLCLAASFAGAETLEEATFAGGCFWCMEKPFDDIEGVLSTESGFSGGHQKNPTYRQVTYGNTGHTEVVQVTFDRDRVSYRQLLDVYWRQVDPFDGSGQFCDRGSSYRPAIFFHSKKQKQAVAESLAALQGDGVNTERFKVEIAPFDAFYAAGKKHQNYYQNNPIRYRYYRSRCGRDDRLEMIWGKPS